ncbi:MAG: ribonuclease P protein component [Cyclobacteriaceae bacterium]
MIHEGLSYTFPKNERLSGKKEIEELFKNGSSFYLHPFIFRYLQADKEQNHKVLFSVPKKKFKRAVDRNLVKRRLREAYRLNKHHLNNSQDFYYLGFVYIEKTIIPFSEIESRLVKTLKRFTNQIAENENQINL